MTKSYCILEDFPYCNSCFCTKHQSMPLKLKIVKQMLALDTHNSDKLICLSSDNYIKEALSQKTNQKVRYKVWNTRAIKVKTRTEEKQAINETHPRRKKHLKRLSLRITGKSTISLQEYYKYWIMCSGNTFLLAIVVHI